MRDKYNFDQKQQSSFSMNELQFHFFLQGKCLYKFLLLKYFLRNKTIFL